MKCLWVKGDDMSPNRTLQLACERVREAASAAGIKCLKLVVIVFYNSHSQRRSLVGLCAGVNGIQVWTHEE